MTAEAEPVRVEFYSGGRADQTPRAVWVGGERVEVARLLEDRLEETHPGRLRRRHMVVETASGLRWLLTYDGESAAWWLSREGR